MIVSWRFDEEMTEGFLLRFFVDLVAKEESIAASVAYTKNSVVKGPLTKPATKKRPHPLVVIPVGGSLGGSFQNKAKFSSLARMRAYVIEGQDIPQDMKVLLCVFSDILHEFGHIKYHFSDEGQYAIDMTRYQKDLEYRLRIEGKAETLTTKWLRRFGFYDLFNDATKLN